MILNIFQDHFRGKIRGYAHQDCNLQVQTPQVISVYAHNSAKFDMLFVLADGLNLPNVKVSGIPFNTQRFRTLKIQNFVLKDTLTFMPNSLDALV